jgi:hypothetical protein
VLGQIDENEAVAPPIAESEVGRTSKGVSRSRTTAVRAHLDWTLALTFAFPADRLRGLQNGGGL